MSARTTLERDIAGRRRLIAASRRLVAFWRAQLRRLGPRRFTMYDAVDVGQIPPDAGAVAGYVDGQWPTFGQLVVRFPKAFRLSIAIGAGEDGECLDIEAGDATPEQAPAWVRRQQARGVDRPVLYASLDTMPAVIAALRAAGIRRSEVRLWVAHYTGVAHVPAGFDACQWWDRAFGRNLDVSLCLASFRA